MTNDNHPGNHKYNGLDMTYRPNVFFFDFMAEVGENLDQTDATPGSRYSVEICVRECPTQLDSAADLINEYNQGNAQFHILTMFDSKFVALLSENSNFASIERSKGTTFAC